MKLVLTKTTASPIVIFLLFVAISILLVCEQVVGDVEAANTDGGGLKRQSFLKMIKDTVVLLKTSPASSWDKIKAVVHDLQLQLSPPNLEGSVGENVGVTEAVKASIGTGKTKVEESAKAAGEGVHEVASKVKKSVSDHHKQHADDEL